MKHGKLLVLLGVLLVLCSLVFVSCADEADDHEYTSWSITQDPTETTPGKAIGTCDCGESKEFDIPALTDAVWTLEKTEPTHTASGLAVYTSVYGTVNVTLPAIPHEWVINITTEPTATSVGTALRFCACGESEELDVPVLTDTTVWKVVTTAPTHKVSGKSVYTSEYGTVTVILPVVPHTFGAWSITTDPTKSAAGEATRTCECGEAEKVTLPVLTDATFWNLTDKQDATHAAAGYETYICEYGTVTYVLAVIPHTFGNWVFTTEPTLDAAGVAVRSCECGETETADVAALSDETVWSYAVVTPATHTEAGVGAYTSVYGTVNVTLPVIADHQFGEWTIAAAPTADTTGTATRTCACGETETAVLPVLTDTAVWTLTSTPATYNEAGRDVYTSVYGTVTVDTAKLKAPYDEKTYSDVEIAFRDILNGKFNPGVSWNDATVTIDADGKGRGDAHPFRGLTVITMVDAATGRINIRMYGLKAVSSGTTDPDDPYGDDEGYGSTDTEYVVDYDNYTDYVGYVDFATGLIIRVNSADYSSMFLYTPFEVGAGSDSFKLSVWNGKYIAGTYTYGGTDYNFFSDGTRVYFGVSFADADGDAVSADAAYNTAYVLVSDASGNKIAAFGFDGEKQNLLDGLEGSYANGEDVLVISGYGKLTLNGVSGEYVKAAADAGYSIDAWTLDEAGKRVAYFRITLGDGTYTATEPKVTISFVAGDYATVDDITVDANVTPALPTPTHATMAFKGWFLDEACTIPVGDNFLPATNVTLYASWKAKVIVNLVGVIGDDANVIYMGAGDSIFNYLPSYTLDASAWKKFVGWYFDANGNHVWDEEDVLLEADATVSDEDTGCYVVARWADLPAYYGTFYGTEVWNAGYGNNGGVTLSIDENGNITGFKTGTVVSYDPDTQVVKWKKNGGSTEYTFYYDNVSGVIAGIYNDYNIGNDYYIFSRETNTNGKITAQFGVKTTLPGSTSVGWYAQFVVMNTKLGNDTIVYLYNNRIYAGVTVTTATGEALAVDKNASGSIMSAKTLIVTAADGTRLLALAATDSSFGTGSNTKALDAYFGTYTNEAGETVILDGVGGITYGTKKGVYTLRTDGTFDVYIRESGADKEYYILTILDGEFVLDKPMVTVMFDVNGVGSIEEDTLKVNKNIAFALPSLVADGYVFRGWYLDGDETQKLLSATYKPTEDVILAAKWDVKYTVTVVYNDGTTADTTFAYGNGDKADINNPKYAKHKFDGWFTTATFDAGTEWTTGTAISGNITIYAKWSEAPIYSNTYVPVEVYGTEANGAVSRLYGRTSAILDIDPDGVAPGKAYPFGSSTTVKNYDAATGYLELHTGSNVYKGYVDAETGMIVITYDKGTSAVLGQVMVLVTNTAVKTDDFSSSYWNSGKTRAIEYSYTAADGEAKVLRIFVCDGKVYFGVTFKDALTDGNDVAGKNCYNSKALYVFDKDGGEIARFAYNGTTMVALDGYEGDYTNGDDTLTLDGVRTVKIGDFTGTYTKAAEGASHTFDVYMTENGKRVYYELTVDRENGTYTIVKPMVTITFVTEYGTVESMTVNKNVSIDLPTLEEDTHVFKGWYRDEAFTSSVGNTLVPTADMTVYAKWTAKTTVTLVDVVAGDANVIYMGEGEKLSSYLPSYSLDLDAMRRFAGWYKDTNGNGKWDEADTAVTSTDVAEGSAMTLIAKWESVPAYYGSFRGTELYGNNSGNSSACSLTIDENGKITGTKTGTVISYDPETQILVWNSGSGDNQIACYDAETGVLVVGYYATGIGKDFYIFSRENTTGKAEAQYTLSVKENPASATTGYYARFVQMKTRCGDSTLLFVYNNHIYANITLTNGDGEEVSITTIKNQKMLNINKGGDCLLRVTNTGSTFASGSESKILDLYYGTYTNGDETVVLDGAGNITYGTKKGTYAKGENGTLDVYFLTDGVKTEYATLTLDGETFTIAYPTVSVTYESEFGSFDAATVNRNIAITLPVGADEGNNIFIGWYVKGDADMTILPASYVPTADVTLVAKWGAKVTLTIVYGNGLDNAAVDLASGAVFSLTGYEPAYTNGKSFDGWYADAACTVAFTATSVSADTTVYCKWVDKAPFTVKDTSSKSSVKFTYSNGTWTSGKSDNSTSAMTITAGAAMTVTFNWKVSSESGYDWFNVTINGETKLHKSGEESGEATFTLNAGDELRILYVKDSSGSEGSDCVKITNLTVAGEAVTAFTE